MNVNDEMVEAAWLAYTETQRDYKKGQRDWMRAALAAALAAAPVEQADSDSVQSAPRSSGNAQPSSDFEQAEPRCVCGKPTDLGIVHRADGPCYWPNPAPVEQAEQQPVAWMSDDSKRVITQHTKSGMIADGGAGASSVRVYSVPLYAHPPQPDALRDAAKMALQSLTMSMGHGSDGLEAWKKCKTAAIKALRAALAAAPVEQGEQQPVAWAQIEALDGVREYGEITCTLYADGYQPEQEWTEPLYLHPPQPDALREAAEQALDALNKPPGQPYSTDALDAAIKALRAALGESK